MARTLAATASRSTSTQHGHEGMTEKSRRSRSQGSLRSRHGRDNTRVECSRVSRLAGLASRGFGSLTLASRGEASTVPRPLDLSHSRPLDLSTLDLLVFPDNAL